MTTPLLAPVASAGKLQTNVIHCGEALAILKCLPSNSIHCCISSPPYFGLRSYIDNDDPKKSLELGLEDTPQAYIARLVAIFAECRRVLRDDGVVFINMGDSYAGGGGYAPNAPSTQHSIAGQRGSSVYGVGMGIKPQGNYKHKDLMLMPHRLAIALQDDGWYVRADNVWHKPNPMPESVTDRTTRAHEYVFMLTKNARYFYDADAVREANSDTSHGSPNINPGQKQRAIGQASGKTSLGFYTPETASGRNLRSVWTIATAPYAESHFATFPPELPRLCIKAGCPERVCAVCGAGWLRVVEDLPTKNRTTKNGDGNGELGSYGRFGDSQSKTIGFAPACDCDTSDTVPGITLDPFMGSGTVAVVARELGRDYVGIELNPDYVELAKLRLGQKTRIEHLNARVPEPLETLPMWKQEVEA